MPEINKLLSLARNLRARAREVLAKAETMKDADARREMREIAGGYERLAPRLEQASAGKRGKPVSTGRCAPTCTIAV